MSASGPTCISHADLRGRTGFTSAHVGTLASCVPGKRHLRAGLEANRLAWRVRLVERVRPAPHLRTRIASWNSYGKDKMNFQPIENYGMIANLCTAALVGIDPEPHDGLARRYGIGVGRTRAAGRGHFSPGSLRQIAGRESRSGGGRADGSQSTGGRQYCQMDVRPHGGGGQRLPVSERSSGSEQQLRVRRCDGVLYPF